MKKQVKIIIPVAFLAVYLLISCTKSNPSGEVWVRIENQLSYPIQNTQSCGNNYGTITSGKITSYQLATFPVYIGYCLFDSAESKNSAGFLMCGTPPLPPPFEAGYYTFRIEENGSPGKKLTVLKK